MKRKISFAAILTATFGLSLSAIAQAPRAGTPTKPKLLVVIVIDQFRNEYLTRYAPYFGDGGFKWLMRNGANFNSAHYTYGTTYTGPGHALILSGSYGHTNGIIGNRWYNRATNRAESMFFDPDAKLLGVEAVPKDDDTSPRNFIGSNLSDQLLLSNHFKSKAIGVSLKDRAAIMLAGKLGKAYWYHEKAGGIISSTYYMQDLPLWVKQFNAQKIPDSYFGKTWTKLLPEAAYGISRADDTPHELTTEVTGRTFPHLLTDPAGKPTATYYEGFTATPFATDYQLQLARLAIENEQLGADDYPDILGISITPTDIAGHAFGPDSHEVQDIVVRLDGQLASFFSYLNRRFKNNEVVIALTSDHGACPLPEYMQSLGIEAGRIKKKQISDAIEATLTERFGAPTVGKWVTTLEDPGVFLNQGAIWEKKADAAEVQRLAGEAALRVKGMMAYYTRAQFLSGQIPHNRWASFFEKSFYPERSGDLLLQTKPFYFWGSWGERDEGSTHGSPYEYDTHVPLLLAGRGIRPGTYASSVDMTDLAPTLAALLGINAPAGNEGRTLHEVFAQ